MKKKVAMEILLHRIARKMDYTIGRLYVNGAYVCDTLEDCDRLYYGKKKVKGKTAIPCGRYEVIMNNYSPRFGAKEPYRSVPDFSGVRIHVGNTAADTDGCPLVGKNKLVGKVLESKATFVALMTKYLNPARKRKERVFIVIK